MILETTNITNHDGVLDSYLIAMTNWIGYVVFLPQTLLCNKIHRATIDNETIKESGGDIT